MGIMAQKQLFSWQNFIPAIRELSEGCYIVSATTSSFGEGGTNFWILKLANNGDCSPVGSVTDAGPYRPACYK